MSKISDPDTYQNLQDNLTQNPKDPDAWMKLGYFHMDSAEYLQAQPYFQKVLTLKPGDIEAQVNLDRIKRIQAAGRGSIKRFDTDIRTWIEHEIPLWLQLLISFISFTFIFAIAQIQKWDVSDMVWSLWITSLTLGYCYLIAGITSKAIHTRSQSVDGILSVLENTSIHSSLSFIVIFVGALFQFLFFSIHFGLFHFAHSIFLNEFFPLVPNSDEKFSNFFNFISISLQHYWPVIFFSLLSSLRRFQRVTLRIDERFMIRPYINVVKIHLSIFAFAGLSATGIMDWVLPVIFIVYFFPFSATFEYLKGRWKTAEKSD
jgi:hypothetical protein